MDVSAISNLYKSTASNTTPVRTADTNGFDSVLNNAMKLVSDTNTLQNQASAQEVSFALGESDNVHDLIVAQQKANMAIQYTVAVRNQFIQGYNTIMNMQI